MDSHAALVYGNALPDVERVVKGNTAFALDLYAKLRSRAGNLFFSPYSLSTALAMTYAGARGDTATQMVRTLHLTLEAKDLHPTFARLEAGLKTAQAQGGNLLTVANSLWPDVSYPLLKEFVELTKEYYGVLVIPVDYGNPETARQTINAWVDQKTQGKIKDLILPGMLEPLTRLVLVNASYFKGRWTYPFEERATEDAPFRITASDQVQVPMMAQTNLFGYGEDDGLQILELPYAGDNLAMVVLLPRSVDGLTELETALTVANLEKWTSHLSKRRMPVSLPRFKTTLQFELSRTLAALGMVDAFDAQKANFSGMDGKEHELYLGLAVHKAFIDVNEEGTEAAAATAIVARTLSFGPPPLVFRADHPFVFFIREKISGSILFLGRVANPLSQGA